VIDSTHHIEIDGVKYRLAQSVDGQHHIVRGEPLRPPNAVTVQGESAAKFQPRPEILLWNWTDWSQGEGQLTTKSEEAGRAWELTRVRAFEEPGKLSAGYYVQTTQDSTGSADFAEQGWPVKKGGSLYFFTRVTGVSGKRHLWDGAKWGAANTLTGMTNGVAAQPVADEDFVFFVESGTGKVWKWASGVPATVATSMDSIQYGFMAQTDNYVYTYRPEDGQVYEIDKAGTGTAGDATVVDSWTNTGYTTNRYGNHMCSNGGKIYVMVSTRAGWTSVREITPTSAAGAGYGAEIARIEGFQGEGMWAHNGTIYLVGIYRDPAEERAILYITPDQSYGTLGELRKGHDLGYVTGGGARMLDHFVVSEHLDSTNLNHALFQIDSVSGGFACLAYDEIGDPDSPPLQNPVVNDDGIFWTAHTGSTDRTLWARPDEYQSNASAISPEHDFDLVSKKFLSSLVLSCSPLPTNDWTVYVDYMIDDNTTWTNAITYNTLTGTGTEVTVTTDSATVEFRTLKLRIRLAYTGMVQPPQETPVIYGVEARAVVAEKVKVFQYVIDLSSDDSGGSQSKSGDAKVDLFLATCAKATSVDLKDGYTSGRAGEYDQYDVFVDDYSVVLQRPGEGFGTVTLREVV